MDPQTSPSITSFVIRFIQDEPTEAGLPLSRRIIVRHVQSDQEISCTRWADVVAYVQLFVALEDGNQ
jgi:hypothetical protein